MQKERAHKLIAQSGLMSRRKAELAIAEGRVALNGVVFTEMGTLVDLSTDLLTVDGILIKPKTEKHTYLFHKPRGVVTTKQDELGRPTVMDYFRDDLSLNPVGRLDFDSEGLLLMTHDGDLLLKLTHPRYGVKKIYEVEVSGGVTHSGWLQLQQDLLTSVTLDDGPGKFDAIEIIGDSTTGNSSSSITQFKVTVSEGRNRFVRRMFEALGLRVVRLKRTQMGEHELGDLKPGEKRKI